MNLRGTPVVPGVAYGPVVVVTARISQHAIDAFERLTLDEEEAIAAYDGAVTLFADRLAGRAEKASGSAAEVLTADAGDRNDKRRDHESNESLPPDPHADCLRSDLILARRAQTSTPCRLLEHTSYCDTNER